MAYWLFKSEPESFSWRDQERLGARGGQWDGVRSHQAKNNMLAMKTGDLGFFYHSVNQKCVIGVVEVVAEAHADSTDETGTWSCVDLRAVGAFPEPVTLAQIKAEPKLKDMVLVVNSRLSVQPVTAAQWRVVCEMGGYAG